MINNSENLKNWKELTLNKMKKHYPKRSKKNNNKKITKSNLINYYKINQF